MATESETMWIEPATITLPLMLPPAVPPATMPPPPTKREPGLVVARATAWTLRLAPKPAMAPPSVLPVVPVLLTRIRSLHVVPLTVQVW